MKKILLIFLFLVSLVNYKMIVFGEEENIASVTKPVICAEGNDYNHYFNYDGYDQIENNVNYNLPGRYNIVYENKKHQRFVKNIDVVNKNSLDNLSYYQEKQNNMFNNSSYYEKLTSILEVGNLTYLSYNLEDEDINSKVCLNIYENEKLIKNIVLRENLDLKIVKIISYFDDIMIIGSLKTNNNDDDIYILNLTKYGDFISDCKMGGTDNETVKDAVILNDCIYIIGQTYSHDIMFSGKPGQDGFVLKIDPDTYQIDEIFQTKYEGNDYITNFVVIDDNFYFGLTYMLEGKVNHSIIKLNNVLELVDRFDFGHILNFEFIKLVTDNTNLYFLNSVRSDIYNKNICVLYTLNKNLKFLNKKSFIFDDYNVCYGRDLVVSKDHVISLLFEVVDKSYKRGFCYKKILGQEEILDITKLEDLVPLRFINEEGSSIFLMNNNSLVFEKINMVRIQEFGPSFLNDFTSVDDYQVLINSSYVNYDKKLSKLDYDLNHFGEYRLIYGFETKDLIFFYHLDSYLEDKINIVSDENYDLNYHLYFNGDGVLNGSKISSGYVLTKTGEYSLEVTGNKGIKKILSFSISDNSNDLIYLDEKLIEPEIETLTKEEINLNEIMINKDLEKHLGNKEVNNWMYIIPAFILSTSFILIWKVH